MEERRRTAKKMLKIARFRMGLSQHQAAIRCGVSLSSFQQAESGKRTLSADVLAKIAKSLGIEPMEIYALWRYAKEEDFEVATQDRDGRWWWSGKLDRS